MANGDIPVTGSATRQARFPIKAKGFANDSDNKLTVRTDKLLHIFVDNGAGRLFDADLVDPNWFFDITERGVLSARAQRSKASSKRKTSSKRQSSK